jgi:hypothetical protein
MQKWKLSWTKLKTRTLHFICESFLAIAVLEKLFAQGVDTGRNRNRNNISMHTYRGWSDWCCGTVLWFIIAAGCSHTARQADVAWEKAFIRPLTFN